MTVFHLKKKLACGKKCHEKFTAQVMAICPTFESGVSGHITIYHSTPYHQIWVTFYNTSKGHENWTAKGIEYTKLTKIQKKFKGDLPTQHDLEDL